MAEIIEGFISDWEFFHFSYLTGWLAALLLSLVGVVVVARDQIFLGAALSQSSTLGVAVTLALGAWLGHDAPAWLHTSTFATAMAILFSVLAALATAGGGAAGRESHEALTGWVFLASASLSLLLVASSPEGLEEVHRLTFGSTQMDLIGVTETDFWVALVLASATVLAVGLCHRRLLLLAMDPAMAAAVGIRTRLWTLLVAAWVGLGVGLSINVSGLLFTFGCLVLPALVAKSLVREVRLMFLVAPIVAVAATFVACIVAPAFDLAPGQMSIALMCFLLGVVWGLRVLVGRRRRR